jgi:hypothetical protein
MMRRLLIPSVSMIVLACSSLLANAQTGPVGGKGGQSGAKSGQPAQVGQGLTPERVASLLQAKGAQTKITTAQNQNAKFTIVQAKMSPGDFNYDFNVVFVTFNNGNKVWYLSAMLNPNYNNLSQSQLQGLLKENFIMSGENFFMIDSATSNVLLQSGRYSVSLDDQNFDRMVNVYMGDIKATSNLWYTAP